MQRLIFIFSLFILAIVGCSSNESHSFLIRPDGGGEDAATEIEVGKTIPAPAGGCDGYSFHQYNYR